jgi:hypothetical protein
MRAAAIIFSVIGFYYLLRALDLQLQFLPLHPTGHEGVVIEAVVTPLVGVLASFVGMLFAFVDFARTRRRRFWYWILAWCGLQILCLAVLFICC